MEGRFDKPAVIGLCGRSGAGKGFASALFAELGIPSVDTDAVYRELTSPRNSRDELSDCMKELVCIFGEGILADDLSLDRRRMADIVFAVGNREKLEMLNRVTHRHILKRTDELIMHYAELGAPAVVVDAPVLFESGYDKKCDLTVALTAPDELLAERIMRRDGITEEMVKRRLASQKSTDELQALADMVIVNDGTEDELREKIKMAADLAIRKGKRKSEA